MYRYIVRWFDSPSLCLIGHPGLCYNGKGVHFAYDKYPGELVVLIPKQGHNCGR